MNRRFSKDRFARAAQALVPRVAQSFFKLIEYIIRCWTFDVRCSMFFFLVKLSYQTTSTLILRSDWTLAAKSDACIEFGF